MSETYITANDLIAAVPAEHRDAAAGDAPGGAAAVLAEVCRAASLEVDGLLGSAPAPEATRRQAALWIALDLLAVRRQLDWARVRAVADQWRDWLRAQAGKLGLGTGGAGGGGTVIGEPSRTCGGGAMF